MHAKITVADDIAFVGSFNLSHSGELNAENVLEIRDAAIADRLAAFVDEIRALYPLVTLPEDKTRSQRHLRFCDENRSPRPRRGSRSASPPRRPPAAAGAGVPGLPGHERVEPARRQAAGRAELGPDRRARSASTTTMHADFGSGLWDGGPIGIPITVVRGTRRSRASSFEYAAESDKGPYPIPTNVAIEGGRDSDGDRHALIVDRDSCKLYELFALYPTAAAAGAPARARSSTSARTSCARPAGRPPTRPASPILPGLARYEDVARGRIDHALRFTVQDTRRAYVWPARHFASDQTDPDLPPMGMRFRLKQSYPIAGFPRQARIVLQALKEYGMIVADNGSNWFVSGAPHPKWSNDQLHTLHRVPGSAFEVVDGTKLRP